MSNRWHHFNGVVPMCSFPLVAVLCDLTARILSTATQRPTQFSNSRLFKHRPSKTKQNKKAISTTKETIPLLSNSDRYNRGSSGNVFPPISVPVGPCHPKGAPRWVCTPCQASCLPRQADCDSSQDIECTKTHNIPWKAGYDVGCKKD